MKKKESLRSYRFMFEELTKRDFKKKYKGSVLGIFWSVLSPILTMLVMRLVFTQFFGRTIAHYTTYIFAGNIVFSYFREATAEGMTTITSNASILSKIDIPKVIFLLSKSVSVFLNFMITVVVFFLFCAFDGITFTWRFFALVYPILCLTGFCTGMALMLSALYVFKKDVGYLWEIFLRLLMYMSAVFYRIDTYPQTLQNLFLLNPVYVYITYFRIVTIDGGIPSMLIHGLALFYAAAAVAVGTAVFLKKQDRFIFYF
jgi:ABC-2 type transport system permease protein